MEFGTNQDAITLDDTTQTITITHRHSKSSTKTSTQTIPYQAISNYTITDNHLPDIRKLSLEFPNCPPCSSYSPDPYSVLLNAETINQLQPELDRVIATTGRTHWKPTARIQYLCNYSDQKTFYKDFAYTDPKLTYNVSIDNDDHCAQDIVGSHYYLDTYEKIIEINNAQPQVPFFVEVQLILEPDNPYAEDGHAISVRWNNKLVGYIPQQDAHPYWQLARITASGYTPTTRCKIYYKRTQTGEVYVRPSISLRPPHAIAPLNDPPQCTWALLPRKSPIAVAKTYNHTNTLLDFVPPSGDGELFVTFEEQKIRARTRHPTLTVKIDGKKVGVLPSPIGAHVLPLYRHFENIGVALVAIGRIKGSSHVASLILDTSIADTFLDDPHLSPLPRLLPLELDPDLYQVPDCYKAFPSTVMQLPPIEIADMVEESLINEEKFFSTTPDADSSLLAEDSRFFYEKSEALWIEEEQVVIETVDAEPDHEFYDQTMPPSAPAKATTPQHDFVQHIPTVDNHGKHRRVHSTSTARRSSRASTAVFTVLIGINTIGLIANLFSDKARTREFLGTLIFIFNLTVAFGYLLYCRCKDAKKWKE